MKDVPLISVIVPVYNSENTVLKTAMSVLEQPNSNFIELLLIDDGSTDGSGVIIDNLSDMNNNVKVFHKENGGVSSARNLGMEKAQGKYLAFLDSDDWWSYDFLTDDLIEDLLQPQSSDIYCFSYQKVSPNKKWCKPQRVKPGAHTYNEPALSNVVGQHHSAFLYLRRYIISYGFRYFPTKVWEDVPFSQLCCTFAKSITCIDRIMFSYYMNQNSCMHTKNSINKFMGHYQAEYLAKEQYESNGVPYDIDRTIISVIGEYLRDISIENSYGFVKELIDSPEFYLLKHSDVQPWYYIQGEVRQWRENSFFAYVKCRLIGIPKYIKRVLQSFRVTKTLADVVQYRFIEKWERL